ncbi:LmbU family transcriptional regulator [Nonomuraea sp. NPDC050783]|uniref:LmbU family transcriptional regulator n=1 Tax=Nonomuraea sp. NPDC050783 TaxID=3154634 RepID=UPI0034657538
MAAGAGRPSIGSGIRVHKSGLLFTSRQSLEMWEQAGSRLFAINDSSTWWIADWLVYGESTFQDRYEEAIKRTSLSYQTLRNYTWVARRFPLPRRRAGLSFSHHLEVVALDQPEQDYWLRKAEELSWSRNKLRAEVKGSLLARRGESPLPDAGGSADAGSTLDARLLHLELSAEDLARLERAATRDGEPLKTWAAAILRQAAARS